MYAIIEVGAKQYVVKKDDVLTVERLTEAEGKDATLSKVLLLSKDKKVEVGQPYLKGVKVKVHVLRHLRGEKIVSYKYRRRKSSHWTKGHRQNLSEIKIKDFEAHTTE
ncbi:MAG: 50S ribosomal protein L21 [Candidatus Omnitrophica bacterium]|nr:50S ribosomal protein L21 [Candidatus Omnitrophota bacterium]MDD5610146.1 50S ribosomal protein L21 [Candidatus Omnitrophota bacterium]